MRVNRSAFARVCGLAVTAIAMASAALRRHALLTMTAGRGIPFQAAKAGAASCYQLGLNNSSKDTVSYSFKLTSLLLLAGLFFFANCARADDSDYPPPVSGVVQYLCNNGGQNPEFEVSDFGSCVNAMKGSIPFTPGPDCFSTVVLKAPDYCPTYGACSIAAYEPGIPNLFYSRECDGTINSSPANVVPGVLIYCPASTSLYQLFTTGGTLSVTCRGAPYVRLNPCGCLKAGDPINLVTGMQSEQETDYSDASGRFKFVREFNNLSISDGLFQSFWQSNIDLTIRSVISSAGNQFYYVTRPDGDSEKIAVTGSTYTSVPDSKITLISPTLLLDTGLERIETYDGGGRVTNITDIDGYSVSYSYLGTAPTLSSQANGTPTSTTDVYGRSLSFSYNQYGQLSTFKDSVGTAYSYFYGPASASDPTNLLTAFTAPNGTKSYTYAYSGLTLADTALGTYAYGLWKLASVADENGNIIGNFNSGAQSTAGVTVNGNTVNGYSVARTSGAPMSFVATAGSDSVQVSDSRGQTTSYQYQFINGTPQLISQTTPPGAGSSASSRNYIYDVNGNRTSTSDELGNLSCSAYDLSRNLEATRVEGLTSSANCANYMALNATLPVGVRKVTTSWHPDWRRVSAVAEPLKLTTSVYNGQPDPFNSNAILTCAPVSALLPTGKPIVVLCKKVEQATTDSTGGSGFSATLQSNVAARVWQWTYNSTGQVLTTTDPRGNVTTNAYYTDTSASHTVGDLLSVTNAANQVTQFTSYEPNGRNLAMTDPNGTVTTKAYSPRGWLTQVSVAPSDGEAAQVTQYVYDAAGQRTQVTMPDQTVIKYTYDAAHRLTAVQDSAGNTVNYSLNSAGDRIEEDFLDSHGALLKTITRVFDGLGRVQTQTGAAQ